MAADPLEQMQQLLQAQERLWKHFSEQEADQQPWSTMFQKLDEIDDTARTLSDHAKAYGDFAKAFVEKLQSDETDSSDHLKHFLEQFQQYRDRLRRNEFAIPEGFEALFSGFSSQDGGLSALPFMQSQWHHQLDRIKHRFHNAEQTLTAFQHAYSEFQMLEQQLNQQVYRKVEHTFSGQHHAPEKLREYVDAWIDNYEECYQAHIQTQEYQQSYEALISSVARLQQQTQQCWDEEYRLFGLVPAGDYDQLLERHHRLQKQVRQQQQQLDTLAEQLQALTTTAKKQPAKKTSADKPDKNGAAPTS